MPRDQLNGITINGVALNEYLEKEGDSETRKDIIKVVRESTKKHFYYVPRVKCKHIKQPYEKRGPVMVISNVEIHQQNKESYIKKMLQTNNIKGSIVAVLLSGEKPLTAFQIKERINTICPSDPVKAAQIRVYIGYILKSEFGLQIEKNYKNGRTRGAEYFLRNEAKMQHSLESACEAANKMVAPTKKKLVDEKLDQIKKDNKESEPDIDEESNPWKFGYVQSEGTIVPPTIEINGKIEFHHHFHFHIH